MSKPENKISELWKYLEKQIKEKNQIYWVCPLIEDSKFLNYSSAKKKFDIINKKFPQKVGLIHGALQRRIKKSF